MEYMDLGTLSDLLIRLKNMGIPRIPEVMLGFIIR